MWTVVRISIIFTEVKSVNSITVTSQWARWRLKSLTPRLFVQPFVQAQVKENIKAPRHWPLWRESTGYWWVPLTKRPVTRKMFPFDDVIMNFFLNPGLGGYHAILKDCQYWNCLWMIAWSLHGITQQYANEAFSHVFVKKCPCTNSVCCHHHQVSKITHGKNGFLDVVSQSQIKSNECFSNQSSWCFCHGTHSSSCTYKRSRPYFTRPWRRPLWDIST